MVSEFAGETAGAALLGLSHHQVRARGREAPLAVRAVVEVEPMPV